MPSRTNVSSVAPALEASGGVHDVWVISILSRGLG
jgi:hypothetical protein